MASPRGSRIADASPDAEDISLTILNALAASLLSPAAKDVFSEETEKALSNTTCFLLRALALAAPSLFLGAPCAGFSILFAPLFIRYASRFFPPEIQQVKP